METKIDLNRYKDFVEAVTSEPSNDIEAFIIRVRELDTLGVNVPLLITGGIGLASEGGEFNEIIKKMLFQGKPYNEENRFHMKRELGDIGWYWINACRALGYDPNDVISENVSKLESRYPGGHFDAHYSENRKAGDL
jgi:NTP pyrophosphatase (non-canonical NTP hydrolase)